MVRNRKLLIKTIKFSLVFIDNCQKNKTDIQTTRRLQEMKTGQWPKLTFNPLQCQKQLDKNINIGRKKDVCKRRKGVLNKNVPQV